MCIDPLSFSLLARSFEFFDMRSNALAVVITRPAARIRRDVSVVNQHMRCKAVGLCINCNVTDGPKEWPTSFSFEIDTAPRPEPLIFRYGCSHGVVRIMYYVANS